MTFPIVLALGGLQLATVEVWIYDRVQRLDYAEAATLAILETILSLGLTYAYLRYESARSVRQNERVAVGGAAVSRSPNGVHTETPRRARLRARRAGRLRRAGGESRRRERHRRRRLHPPELRLERQLEGATFQTRPLPAIRNSLLFGVATLLIAVPMGVTVSVLTARAGRAGTVVDALAMLPLAVSGIVFGSASCRTGLRHPAARRVAIPGDWRGRHRRRPRRRGLPVRDAKRLAVALESRPRDGRVRPALGPRATARWSTSNCR